MAFIPEDVLYNIKEAADIRQVIQEFVPLKKRGKNWVGLCPFHPDSSPSFTVNEEKQIYYCFGCGEGGNVFKFLMRLQGLSFVEAAKLLAQRYGIKIPKRPLSKAQEKKRQLREELIEINKIAAEYFYNNLRHSHSAIKAKEYLNKRGLDNITLESFLIGWAQDSWDALINNLSSKGFSLELIEKTGLIIKREGASGYYDRFRGRIIFPIHNHRGDIVAFGGRTIDLPNQKEQPKYINSPESPVYHKSHVLYGLFQNKSSIRQAGFGLVVEGYMDVVSLWQFGIKEVVGTLGTALTEDHARRMKNITKQWILLFDSDEAGLKAAQRALPICYKFDLRPKVLILPEGEDPDSFIRKKGKNRLLALIEKAPSGIDFLINVGLDLYGADTEGKLKTADTLISIISQIQDPIRKSLFIGETSQRLGIREESLWERIKNDEKSLKLITIKKAKREKAKQQDLIKPGLKIKNRAEEKLLGFLLSYPQFIDRFLEQDLELWISDKNLFELWQAIQHLYSMQGKLDLVTLCERLEPMPHLKTLAMRLASEFPPCHDLEEMASELLQYCSKQKKRILRLQLLEQLRHECKEDSQEILKYYQSLH